jgi:thioester reductase-like protein
MDFWEVVLLFFGMAFGVGALAMVLEHLQKIAAIKAQVKDRQYQDALRRLEELAQQVQQIRQMHTDHVLGMDSHLQHLEYRLSSLESRIEQMEQEQHVHR